MEGGISDFGRMSVLGDAHEAGKVFHRAWNDAVTAEPPDYDAEEYRRRFGHNLRLARTSLVPNPDQVEALVSTYHPDLREKWRKIFRDSVGISQKQLSELSGVEQGYISSIENEGVNFTVETMAALSGALGVDLSDLLLPEDEFADLLRPYRGKAD